MRNGVSYYTTGSAHITVHFPEDQVKCQWCEYLKNEQSANRNSCRLTGEKLLRIFEGVGHCCPLEFESEKGE